MAPGERLAIECDGDQFHGPEQWENDIRRQRVLERLGWTFRRVRASEYYVDPARAMAPLWERLELQRTRFEAASERAAQRAEARAVRAAHDDVAALVRSEEELSPDSVDTDIFALELDFTDFDTSSGGTSSPHVDQARHRAEGTPDPAVVRSWARSVGYDVGSRGRLRPEIVAAYREMHP